MKLTVIMYSENDLSCCK